MMKYEYQLVSFNNGAGAVASLAALNELGSQGWKVISTFATVMPDGFGGTITNISGVMIMRETPVPSDIPDQIKQAFS